MFTSALQTVQGEAIQFYEFSDKLPLRQRPVAQKVLDSLARSLVSAMGLGNVFMISEEGMSASSEFSGRAQLV